jgi:SSS family solute:Na+ symporter
MICTHGGNQVALQRYFTVGSPGEARKMLLTKMAAEILLMILLAATGFALLSFYSRQPQLLPAEIHLTDRKEADAVFPYFIAHQLPPMVAGGVVAALFAAAMSTISSGVNSIAAVMVRDFMRPWLKDRNAAAEEPNLGHWFTVASGCLITALAYAMAYLPEVNFIDLMPKMFNWTIGPLGGLFFLGMFAPRCTSRIAVPATLTGLAVGLALAWWKELIGGEFSPFWVIPCACLATVSTGLLMTLFCPGVDSEKAREWTWRQVMRRDVGQPQEWLE